MKRILKIPIFLTSNVQHLELFWGFPSKWQSRQSQNDMLLFLENIEFKTKFTLPSNTKKKFRYVLPYLFIPINFAGQCLFTNFILLRSKDMAFEFYR